MRFAHAAFTVLLAMLLLPAGRLLAQAQLPTMDEIQQDYDAGKYLDTVRKISQVSSLRGPAAQNYDKARLYVLKAESHLKLSQLRPAQDAFALAAKASTDEKDIAMNTAMSLLVQKSPGFNYRPRNPLPGAARGTRPDPIGIVDAGSRKQALTALFQDELKADAAKIKALQEQKSLPPIMSGIVQLQDLKYLEIAATGAGTEFQAALGDLGGHAAALMVEAMGAMDADVTRVSRNANKASVVLETLPTGQQRQVNSKAGLNSTDVTVLRDTIATAKQITAACTQFTRMIPVSASALANASAQADKLAARADQVLNADYGTGVSDVITAPSSRIRRGSN